MAKHGRKRNNIARYSRAYTHTSQEFYVFCCHKCHTNSITHYVITVYIYFRNNIPHCHTFTLLLHPKKSPKHHPQNNFSISNLKQHVVFHKTTRCFQQNHASLSIKRYVVLGMMKYFQFHPLWHLWQQKDKTPSTGARIRARKNTFGQHGQHRPIPLSIIQN